MCEIRDRSVVRSSVIPSAKYCCSGSLFRLAKGSTTIDRRGATAGSITDRAVWGFSVVVPTASGGVGEDLVCRLLLEKKKEVTSAAVAATAGAGGRVRRWCAAGRERVG